MTFANLEEKIRQSGGPVPMLRNAPGGAYDFPMQPEYSNWRDEQLAWTRTAVVFDQSHHMTDVTFRGPDAIRLLSDLGVNTMSNFAKNRAKQYIACNYDGYVIGDGILIGLEDDEVSLIGGAMVSRWVQFHAETGGYDVTVSRDERTPDNRTGRRNFRYQLQGPKSMEVIEAAIGGPLPEIKPFHVGAFPIGDCPVRALNHSMSGRSGLEIWGPSEQRQAAWAELLSAGREFGLRPAGAISYSTTALESGWYGVQMPAIYSGDAMKSYREWVGVNTIEANASIGGSFRSADIEDYYMTPWDIGAGATVKFDHDFVGRSALERMAQNPRRRKVWLRWNDADASRVMADSLLAGADRRTKYMTVPNAVYSTWPADSVLIGDRLVGLSAKTGYTVNIGGWSSIATIDVADGTEVSVLWGEEDGGTAKPAVERHVQARIRATIRTSPLV